MHREIATGQKQQLTTGR